MNYVIGFAAYTFRCKNFELLQPVERQDVLLPICRAGDDAEEFSPLIRDTCLAKRQSVMVEHLRCLCHEGIAELC